MVNNYRKANNIEVTMGLNLKTQDLFKKLPEDLKIHVVRYALTELGLVGTNDAILSKLNSPTWKNTYIKFVKEPGYATLINFIKLLNEIVTSEYQFANATNGPYQKERLLYQTFIDAITRMDLEKQSLSTEPLERSNTVSAASLSRSPSEITPYIRSLFSSTEYPPFKIFPIKYGSTLSTTPKDIPYLGRYVAFSPEREIVRSVRGGYKRYGTTLMPITIKLDGCSYTVPIGTEATVLVNVDEEITRTIIIDVNEETPSSCAISGGAGRRRRRGTKRARRGRRRSSRKN